jgi:hypothetical protein
MSQPPDLAAGQAAFYDSVTPALAEGDYQVIVTDTITVEGEPAPAAYGQAQRFRVTGPRVALGPHDVVATSPPAGSQGRYDNWLPQVVLAQRSLPWQVSLTGQDTAASGSPAQPWLAVLLLTRAEIDAAGKPPAPGSTGTQTVPIGSYLTPPTGTLGPAVTPGLTQFQQEQPTLTCSVVDVTFEAFRAVAPQTTELPYLVHVRQVGTGDQEELSVPAPGWYSVVTGNRLPTGAQDGVYIAHLVSLEGFASYLPDQPAPQGHALVRLVSLASWSFTSGSDAGDFAFLMGKLSAAPFRVPVSVTGTDAASQVLATAVADGYTLLGYATRLGEQTAAWYRGPFQPAPVTANPQPAYQAASAAFLYDPATGIFDASYAAAWEIGRLLTLANGPVARSLAGWVAGAAAAARRLLAGSAATARSGGASAARLVIARQVVPALLGRAGGRAALGPPGDPAGLRGRHLPGLLDEAALDQIVARPGDHYQQVYDHAIAAAGEEHANA